VRQVEQLPKIQISCYGKEPDYKICRTTRLFGVFL